MRTFHQDNRYEDTAACPIGQELQLFCDTDASTQRVRLVNEEKYQIWFKVISAGGM